MTFKKTTYRFIILLLVFMAGMASLYIYRTSQNQFTDDGATFIYTDYGVYVPTKYSIYGIDVSKYQKKINWKEVKKMKVQEIAIEFVFIKASEGKYLKDKNFMQNWKGAKENGLIRGAYHYYLPDGNPKAQAQNFMESVQLLPGDLPPVIDIEDRGIGVHKTFIKNIKLFINEIENYCNCAPIIYSYDSFFDHYLKGQFIENPLWIARYGPEKPQEENFQFWQFTDHAQVNGIGPKVDMNVFAGDSSAFQQLLLQ